MAKYPRINCKSHKRFCELNGWTLREGDHSYYEKKDSSSPLPLWTKISHQTKKYEYGPDLQKSVLKQLGGLTQEQFWTSVNTRTPVDYSQIKKTGQEQDNQAPTGNVNNISEDVVQQLTAFLQCSEEVVYTFTPEQADRLLSMAYSLGPNAPELSNLKSVASLDEFRKRQEARPDLNIFNGLNANTG